MNPNDALLTQLGRTDVYLLDQFMKHRFDEPGRVLDVGCGSGRNLDLFLRGGHDVSIADERPEAVDATVAHATALGFDVPKSQRYVGALESLPFPEAHFDTVLCIAVLHFARDHAHWNAMVDALWRTLAPGGVLFTRLTSSIGIEAFIEDLGDGRHRLGDGSERYLVTLEQLLATTERLGGALLEPVKTVNVQNLRCMTTWCLQRR